MPDKKRESFHLGEILVRNEWMTWDQLQEALEVQRETGKALGEILVEMEFVTKKDLYRALSIQFDIPFWDLDRLTIKPETAKIIPKKIALKYQVIPLVEKANVLFIAVATPENNLPLDEIREYVKDYEVRAVLASPDDVKSALQQHYGLPDE